MKAERRHELQTNDLAKKIIQAPDYMKLYGGRIAFGVIVVAAGALLVNYRITQKRENIATSEKAIAEARDAVQRLETTNMAGGLSSSEMAQRRRSLIETAVGSIEQVNEKSDDEKLRAQAGLLKGDLYWTAANLSELPGAATQPALQLSPNAHDALSEAQQAYEAVVQQYPSDRMIVLTAKFGLAAVAENQGKWDEAKREYDSILSDPQTAEAFKMQAETRARMLSTLQRAAAAAGAVPAHSTVPATAPTH